MSCVVKELKRGNRICGPLCYCYGVIAILTVTYGDELLYLWIWHDHLALNIVAACFMLNNLNVCDISQRKKGNIRIMKLLGELSYKKNPEVQ